MAVSVCFVPMCCRRRLLWWWVIKALSYAYRRIPCHALLVEQWYLVLPQSLEYLVSGPWLPKQYQGWVLSCGVGLKPNLILVGYSYSFVPSLHKHTLQAGHHRISKSLQIGWCLHFSFGSMQSAFLYQRHQYIVVKALCRYQLYLSVFNELCRGYLQQLGPCHQFVDSKLQSWQQPWLCGGSHGSPLANYSIRCNPCLVLKSSFANNRCPVGALYPPLFGHFTQIILQDIYLCHILVYILGSFYYISFPYCFSNGPYIQLFLLIVLPSSPSSLPLTT